MCRFVPFIWRQSIYIYLSVLVSLTLSRGHTDRRKVTHVLFFFFDGCKINKNKSFLPVSPPPTPYSRHIALGKLPFDTQRRV